MFLGEKYYDLERDCKIKIFTNKMFNMCFDWCFDVLNLLSIYIWYTFFECFIILY